MDTRVEVRKVALANRNIVRRRRKMARISDELCKKWNQSVDKSSIDDVKQLEANNGNSQDFEELPVGTYAVKLEKLELASSKAGDPMLTVWLKIIEGKYKNRLMFINQVVDAPFKIHNANEILRGLLNNTESKINVEWLGDYRKYADLIATIYDEVKDSYTWDVEYTKNNKGFALYSFVETYDN